MFSMSGRRTILRGSVPIEFWSMVSLWSDKEMTLRYPLYGDFRTGIDAAGSYRGCLLALQRFAVEHPEYDNVVNWEMDTRFTHTYDHLLKSIHTYAYQASAQTYTRWSVQDVNVETSRDSGGTCKNKRADVIVFSPVRDPRGSGWYWEYDVQGYPSMRSMPRAASVGTNLWLSRRAVLALENVTADQHQSLFCEAMAPSLILGSTSLSTVTADDLCAEQLKLVHYPHPIAFKYQASPAKLNQLLNPPSAALSKQHEEVLKDTSYYYASTIAGQIYGQWQSQADACIKPLLLHPIKSHAAPQDRFRRFAFVKGWFSSDTALPLCAVSASKQCAKQIQADVKRYLGRALDPRGQKSLFRWDVERPRYISKRPWIMNSTTRDLVQSIVIFILVASAIRLSMDWRATRGTATFRGDYIPLAAG